MKKKKTKIENLFYSDIKISWSNLSKHEKKNIYKDIMIANKYNLFKSDYSKEKWFSIAKLYTSEYDIFNHHIECQYCSMLKIKKSNKWFCNKFKKKCSEITKCNFNKHV